MNKTIISYALSLLNDKNNGKGIFELFCQKLILKCIDQNFLPSSGTDAGGDGGIDGWSVLGENNRVKYAFSIDKKSKTKIKSEIKKTNLTTYKRICFLTNQPITQKTKEDINNENTDIDILIYGLDDLVNYLSRNIDLGKYIDLLDVQCAITIDYLRENNQFRNSKDNISQYIPRTIKVWDKNQKVWQDSSLLDYCSNLPLFTILQAPAGYGKTCALQQLHQKILDKETDTLLPPVFISLSSYTPYSLLNMIKEGMTESGYYRCNDFLLLLDGYDEVQDPNRDFLLKELAQLIQDNSNVRKVILTVRENTYNHIDFENFGEVTTTLLNKLTRKDIQALFSNESIPPEAEDGFFQNPFFQEFSDNIFYVVKFIDFYKVNKTIAGNVIELFSFIVEQEIERVFKSYKPSKDSLESLALYMTLNQALEVEDKNIALEFGIDLPMIPFKFSHKSIQEYLAAKKIVKQSPDLVKKLLAKGSTIIPYLTNTLGFVLNILNAADDEQEVFEEIVNWALKGVGNAKRLLQIEADKISSDMNHKIFSAVIEQEAKTGNLFNQPVSLVPFGLREESKKKNLDYLITQIKASKNTNNHHYYTSILQSITYHHLGVFDESYQQSLLDFLIDLLNQEDIDNNQEFIGSLLYCVAYFPVLKKLDSNKIDFLVSQLLSIEKSENIVDNLCQLLLTSDNKFGQKIYFQIYDYILNRILAERGQMAHIVPTQTSDDTYNEPLRVTHWYSFIPLTEKLLKDNPSLVWDIMKYTIDNQEKIADRHSSSSELDDLFQIYFTVLKKELETQEVNETKKGIVIDWIISDSKVYLDSKLWSFLSDSGDVVFLMNIAREVIHRAGKQFFNRDIMDFFLNRGIITEDHFVSFKEDYYRDEDESLKSFFESFCHWIKEDKPIYSYVLSNIPTSLKESIEKSRLQQEEYIFQSKQEEIISIKAYHIAFNNEELKKEVEEIFNFFCSNNISKENFWDHYHQQLLQERNNFALYLFQSSYWAKEENVNIKQLMEYLGTDNWSKNFMTFLIQYCSRNKIDINDFTKEEKQAVISWIKLVLNEYPLDTVDSSLKYIHITLSHVLRNSNFLGNDNRFMDTYKEKIIGLTFSAFPNVIEGALMVSYDSYSLDYLDKYFSTKKLLAFISNNFHHAFSDYQKLISVCGYIASHVSELFPYQKKKMKAEITKYIENHLKESYYPSITDCAFALGFSIFDLNLDRLSNAFVLDERGHDLAHNYSSSFIKYQSHENTDAEVRHLSKALYKAFLNSKDDFHKKTIAEYYIKYNSMSGEIFNFYAEYLLEDDNHTILNQLIHSGSNTPLKTADIEQIEIVNKLFCYSRAKEYRSDRRDGILAIALSSYKAMADIACERDELDLILNSMRGLTDEGHDFLYRQIQEIENDFVERTYEPLSVDEIVGLE